MRNADVSTGISISMDEESRQRVIEAGQQLLMYCEVLSGSTHDAQDLVQTAMQKVLPVLKGAKEHPNLSALLRRVAKNAWIDEMRKRAKFRLCDLENLSEIASVDETDTFPLQEAMQILVERLTPQQRAVVLLCDAFQYTAGEAAGLLRISAGAVKATLHRARMRLKSVTEDPRISDLDEAQQEILEAYVVAFQAADIRMLIHLCQDGPLNPVVATTKVLTCAGTPDKRSQGNRCNSVSMLAA